jgi:hypothetical protein
MSYNYGIISFLNRKQVHTSTAIKAYLEHKDAKIKGDFKTSQYIEDNWTSFASFVDKGIKSGTLKGVAIRLDYYHEEQREYVKSVKSEFESIELTSQEQEILNKIKKEYGVGFIHSFLMKKNIQPVPKDFSYKSKKLQFLPVVRQAIKEGFLS